jgi:OOP family OmpA-OmpF porin
MKMLIQSKIVRAIFTAVIFTALTQIVIAQNEGHPLIKLFEGSEIIGQEEKEFNEQELVIGKVQADGSVNTERLEGKITRLDLRDPENRSTLEIIRNYEQALKEAGFEIKFSCSKEECGPEIYIESIGYYPPERYLTAFKNRKEGNVWISVYVNPSGSRIWIVEERPMETGKVKITADILKTNILKDGHMAVYGIYFDTGKSDIKPESDETIKAIASFLQINPSLQIYVVGHTDNVGSLNDNIGLSQKRAESVVNELITKYKIPRASLLAEGIGPLAPIATNDTKEGKEQNRRVDIVKK